MSIPDHPDRTAIEAGQLESLRALLTELIPGNRFYTQKLEAVGVGFDVSSLDDFSQRFPFTTKHELVRDQADHPPLGTNHTYPIESYTRFHQTSGTTGEPMRWLDTPDSWDWMVDNWLEVYRAAGVTGADRVYFAFSFGPFIGFWLAFESAQRLGSLCVPGGGLGSQGRLQAILDNQATVLCCTPTYAIRLGEVAAQEGMDLSHSRVRRIIVAGEAGGSVPATRGRIEQLWPGARVFDHHGMTELGPVTHECPEQPGVLHVIERGYHAEIIDPQTGRPVQPGACGELIITPLGRTAAPVLRYRTGDLVKQALPKTEREARCVCGRTDLALEGGILSRVDDMVIVRGVNVHPSAVEGVLRRIEGIAEYQVRLTQRGPLTEIRLVIEPEPDIRSTDDLRKRVVSGFQSAFALRVDVEIASAESLPRFEMKAKRWIRA